MPPLPILALYITVFKYPSSNYVFVFIFVCTGWCFFLLPFFPPSVYSTFNSRFLASGGGGGGGGSVTCKKSALKWNRTEAHKKGTTRHTLTESKMGWGGAVVERILWRSPCKTQIISTGGVRGSEWWEWEGLRGGRGVIGGTKKWRWFVRRGTTFNVLINANGKWLRWSVRFAARG